MYSIVHEALARLLEGCQCLLACIGVALGANRLTQSVGALCLASLAFANAAAPNLGFEAGPIGTTAPAWTFGVVDSVKVTKAEGPGDFGIYASYGITVPPILGTQHLRLGTPKDVNQSQNRGSNVATSEAFAPSGGTVSIAFRLFTFEFRSTDRLRFEVLDASGPVSYLLAKAPGNLTSTSLSAIATGCGVAAGSSTPTTAAACDLTINVGKRNNRPADTGVYHLKMTLPSGATSIRLRYTLISGENQSQASWAYFDSVNQPPQAVLRMNPGSESPAFEGDFVVADCQQTVDPDGDPVTCEWTAEGGGLALPKQASGNLAVFWFPDNTPQAKIKLDVTDSAGQKSSVTRNVDVKNAPPVVNALNVEVLAGDNSATTVCRFLDAGIGTFGDAGVEIKESHTLLEPAGSKGGEEWQPAFSSGNFVIRTDGSRRCAVSDGEDSGYDDFSVTEVLAADLPTHLGDASAAKNEIFANAYPLAVDGKYLGTIATPDDIDVFCVRKSAGSACSDPLPAGSEVVVTLEGMPADYDLLVFSNGGSTEASPFFNAPFFNAPFFNAPFFNAPFFNAPFFNAQFNSVPFFNAPFFNAPFFNAPFFNAPVKVSPFFNADAPGQFKFGFTELPLSEVGLAAPDGSNISNSDISVAEIGSLSLKALQSTPGVSLKALSAQSGTAPEKVLVKVAPGETQLYVVVVSNYEAFSATKPYALTIEASTPPLQARLLENTGFCAAQADTGLKYIPTYQAPGSSSGSGTETIILTQRERLQIDQAAAAQAAVDARTYPNTSDYWSAFWTKVDEYASRVNGTVVSVPGSLFKEADENPCSVAIRNELAQTIRDTVIVQPGATPSWRVPGVKSVVLLGGQDVIPVFAVPDETLVGNERDFTADLWVRPGTPLGVAIAEGYNLSDAPYTDLEPTPFRGRWLYLEDRPVARLVESPDVITGDLNAFLNGTSNTGRIAMGYDFFCDGTADAANILGVAPINGPPCGVASWSAQTLRDQWLRGGAQMCLNPSAGSPLEFAVVNAHMTTYAALSADGFETRNYTDTVGSTESRQCLAGTMTATIGCHSGLNIPDAWAVPDLLGLPFDAKRDWVEELGNMIAPYGYGLGDNTVANRLTEGIMTLVLEELAKGKSVGDAVITAKRRYVMGLRELDVHDEDSLITLALFGPPQLTYSLEAQAQMAALAAQTNTSAANTTVSPDPFALNLKVQERASDGSESTLVNSRYDIVQFDTSDRGSWFELNPGDAQATYGRPLLPVTLPVEDRLIGSGQTRIHGVALVTRDAPVTPCPIDGSPRACSIAARFTDLDDADSDNLFDFNPVFPLPQHDWVVYQDSLDNATVQEPQACVETLAPTQLAVATTLDTGQQVRQSLIVGAGQFRCEPGEQGPGGQVVGQHRLFNEAQLVVMHPVGSNAAELAGRDADFDPPQALTQTVSANPNDNSVTAVVSASDALTGGSGISEIIALVYWNENESATGEGYVESYSIKPTGASKTAEPFGYTFVMPNARNRQLAFQYIDGAGNLTQKSMKGALIRAIDVDILTTLLSINGPSSISVKVGDFCNLESPTLSYQIDNGVPVVFTLDNPPPGVTVTYPPCDDSAPYDRTLVVNGLVFPSDGGTLTVTIRAQGASGSDTAQLVTCSDPNEADVMDSADIVGCGFRVESGVVIIDMYIAAPLNLNDVQYRLDLPQYSAQFKYFNGGKVSAPSGVGLVVNEYPNTPITPQTKLEFRIIRLSRLGWNGTSPIQFKQSTQSGVPGAPGQGMPDTTSTFTGIP